MDPKETAKTPGPLDGLTLEQLRERKAKREDERAARVAEQERDLLLLIEKYEEELGPIKTEFRVLDLREFGEGFVVVKPPPATAHKRFMVAHDKAERAKKPVLDEEIMPYVLTGLAHPDVLTFTRICGERHLVATQCMGLMLKLVSANKEEDAEK